MIADELDAITHDVQYQGPTVENLARLRALSFTIRQRERETIWPTNEEEQAAFEKWLCGMTNTPPDAEIDRRDHTYLWALAAWRYRGGLVQPPAADDAVLKDAERWLELEAWSFLRNVLTQGQAIEMDYLNGKYKSYEHLSARLDEAARERRDQLKAALAQRTAATEGKS